MCTTMVVIAMAETIKMIRGNKAIQDHKMEGKTIHLLKLIVLL